MSFLRRQESYALNQSFDRSTQYLNVIVIDFVDCEALIICDFLRTRLSCLRQVNRRGRGRNLILRTNLSKGLPNKDYLQ